MGLQITAEPLVALISRMADPTGSSIVLDAQASEIKQSLITAIAETQIDAPDVDTWKHGFFAGDSQITMSSEVVNLCYRLYNAAENVIGITQYIYDTEIHIPFGYMSTNFRIGAEVTGSVTEEMFTAVENALFFLAETAVNVVKKITAQNEIVVSTDVEIISGRRRRLEEMDSQMLSYFDGMALSEVDRVVT